MSFNKSIFFPSPPKSFEVKFHGQPLLDHGVVKEQNSSSYESGKKDATDFYSQEVEKLSLDYAERQNSILEELNKKVENTLLQLEQRLPDLVMAVTERVLPSITIDAEAVKTIVTSMINEFSRDDEKLDVYLCKSDLDLLKGLSRKKDSEIQK